jgi:hypothetical protein
MANNFFKYFTALNILTQIYVCVMMAGKGFCSHRDASRIFCKLHGSSRERVLCTTILPGLVESPLSALLSNKSSV